MVTYKVPSTLLFSSSIVHPRSLQILYRNVTPFRPPTEARHAYISHHGSPLQPPSTSSQIRHVDRPHTSNLGTIATPLEIFLLFFAILALPALVTWLAWIALSHCVAFVKGKMDDLDVGQQTKKNVKRAGEAPKKAFQFGLDVGRTAMGFLDGVMKSGHNQDRRGRQGERRGLLRHDTYEERIVTGIPRGIYIQGYGYDRERYGDGTDDSSSYRSTSVSIGPREDCEGPCDSSTRRRSVY
ncbi:hypothetical protein N431DRAFT_430278 [Stipitochalara longipes BDJ]|nr:hypothetical protein N431DRAFT_430278 [Stipitochalara longipes BDJ]